MYVGSDGTEVPVEDFQHVWVCHIYCGPAEADQCYIELPLQTEPLSVLLVALKESMKHNFLPCVTTIGGTVMALHFETFIENLKSCPILLAYGQSGSGKTTALSCALSLLGAENYTLFRDISPALNSTAVFGNQHNHWVLITPIQKVASANNKGYGAKQGTISRGDVQPKSTVVDASNITSTNQQR